MKIGILGGTFNPIHNGHLRAAEKIQKLFAFDKLLFIPAGKPPFKKPGFLSAAHRHKMIRLAIKDNPVFQISDTEIRSKSTSYSVETLNKLTRKYRNAEFFFIMGIDTFLDVPKWKQPQRFMELTNLVIISRPGFAFVDLFSSPYLTNVRKKTLTELDRGTKRRVSSKLNKSRTVFLVRIPVPDISASHIRRRIKAGKSVKYLLPDSVESYIISHKLYKS